MKWLLLINLIIFTPLSYASERKVLFLGDSLTEGYGIQQEKAFPQVLRERLKKEGISIEIQNAGSSGSTSASGLKRLKWHLRAKPDILVLALGANDGLRGISVESTKENLSKVIELAQKNQLKVLLAGMKLPYNYGKKYRSDFEAVFKSLVKKYKIKYIPFLLKGVGGKKEMNISDGIHPNEKGHEKIADNLIPFIKELL